MSSILNSEVLLLSTLTKRINPESKKILSKAQEITNSLHVKIRRLYHGYDTMAVYLYPEADTEKMIDATVFFNILYYFDEVYGEDAVIDSDEEKPTFKDIFAIWSSDKTTSNSTVGKSIIKIKEIISKASPVLGERISHTLFSHISSSLKPKKFSTVEEYIETRLEFSGMFLSIDIGEFVYDIDISKKMNTEIPELQKAKLLCSRLGALSNDLFSYPKETHSKYNLISVFMNSSDHLSKEDAIQKAIELVNSDFQAFNQNLKIIQTKSKELTEPDKIMVNKYLDCLTDIVSASYHWQKDTKRYKHALHFFQDMK